MKNQLKKGFTLIELLIVIAIIGILAGIVIASLGGSIDKANDGSVKGSLSALKTDAVVAIESDNTTFDICSKVNVDYVTNSDYTVANTACVQDDIGSKKHAVRWAVVIELKAVSNGGGKNYYCIDGSGAAELTDNADIALNDTVAGVISDGASKIFATDYACN